MPVSRADLLSHVRRDGLTQLYEYTQSLIRGNDARPPNALWHYTSTEGLVGILTSDCLHFTDVRFLNDTSEIEYGRALCRKVMTDILTTETGATARLLTTLLDRFDDPAGITSYVACFCHNGDLLSQWRTYGATGNGFSLGFDTTSTHWRESETGSGVVLRRVEYDPARQRKRVTKILRGGFDLVKKVEQCEDGDEESLAQAVTAVADRLTRWLRSLYLTFKSYAFREEREWRLIAGREAVPSDDLKFRVTAHALVPYIPICEGLRVTQHGSHLPIRKIRCGPGVAIEVSKFALPQFLKKMNRESIQISRADIPVRK